MFLPKYEDPKSPVSQEYNPGKLSKISARILFRSSSNLVRSDFNGLDLYTVTNLPFTILNFSFFVVVELIILIPIKELCDWRRSLCAGGQAIQRTRNSQQSCLMSHKVGLYRLVDKLKYSHISYGNSQLFCCYCCCYSKKFQFFFLHENYWVPLKC